MDWQVRRHCQQAAQGHACAGNSAQTTVLAAGAMPVVVDATPDPLDHDGAPTRPGQSGDFVDGEGDCSAGRGDRFRRCLLRRQETLAKAAKALGIARLPVGGWAESCQPDQLVGDLPVGALDMTRRDSIDRRLACLGFSGDPGLGPPVRPELGDGFGWGHDV